MEEFLKQLDLQPDNAWWEEFKSKQEVEGLSAHSLAELVFPDSGNDASRNLDAVDRLFSDLRRVTEKAHRAIRELPREAGGRKENFWEKQFITNMAWCWKHVSGKDPSTYHPPYHKDGGQEAVSDFLKFLSLTYNLAGFCYQSTPWAYHLTKGHFMPTLFCIYRTRYILEGVVAWHNKVRRFRVIFIAYPAAKRLAAYGLPLVRNYYWLGLWTGEGRLYWRPF